MNPTPDIPHGLTPEDHEAYLREYAIYLDSLGDRALREEEGATARFEDNRVIAEEKRREYVRQGQWED